MNTDEPMSKTQLLSLPEWQKDNLAIKRIRHVEKSRRRSRKQYRRAVEGPVEVSKDNLKGLTRRQIDKLAMEHVTYLELSRIRSYKKRGVFHPAWNPKPSEDDAQPKQSEQPKQAEQPRSSKTETTSPPAVVAELE